MQVGGATRRFVSRRPACASSEAKSGRPQSPHGIANRNLVNVAPFQFGKKLFAPNLLTWGEVVQHSVAVAIVTKT